MSDTPTNGVAKVNAVISTGWTLIIIIATIGGAVWNLYSRVTVLEMGRQTDKEIIDLKLGRIEDKIDALLKKTR